ncbi:hypothetical protein HDU67_001770, partial [Dinochytrium kinnereticum]
MALVLFKRYASFKSTQRPVKAVDLIKYKSDNNENTLQKAVVLYKGEAAAKRMDFRAVAVCHKRRDSAVDLFHGIADKDFNLLIPGWRGNIHSVEPTAVKELKEVENCVLGRMVFILCKAVDRCCTLRKLTGKSAQSQSACQTLAITAVEKSNLAVVLYKRYGAATPNFSNAFGRYINLNPITMSVKPGSLIEPMAVDYMDASEKALVLYKRHGAPLPAFPDVNQCYQPIMHSVQSNGSITFEKDICNRAASLHSRNSMILNTFENFNESYLMFKPVNLAYELNTFILHTAANDLRMTSKADAFYDENVCSEPLREVWSSVVNALEPITQATRLRKLRAANVNKVVFGRENIPQRSASVDTEGRTAALWRRRERQSFTKTPKHIEPSEAVSEEIENAVSIMMFHFAEKKISLRELVDGVRRRPNIPWRYFVELAGLNGVEIDQNELRKGTRLKAVTAVADQVPTDFGSSYEQHQHVTYWDGKSPCSSKAILRPEHRKIRTGDNDSEIWLNQMICSYAIGGITLAKLLKEVREAPGVPWDAFVSLAAANGVSLQEPRQEPVAS